MCTHDDATATIGPRVRPKPSTARDDAPNADKQSFFEGDPGDRAAFVPFCAPGAATAADAQ